jgi:hypothetical protein
MLEMGRAHVDVWCDVHARNDGGRRGVTRAVDQLSVELGLLVVFTQGEELIEIIVLAYRACVRGVPVLPKQWVSNRTAGTGNVL